MATKSKVKRQQSNRSPKAPEQREPKQQRARDETPESSGGNRSIWRGAISFGMVAIPVKLYTAVENKDLAFHLLHDKCGTRLKQIRWCPLHEQEVGWDEIVKGYEYAKNRYVRLTDEDFESIPVPTKNSIALSAFVSEDEIDPIYYEKTYYLEPEAAGLKPFALLRQALEKEQRTAVAKIATA